MLTVGRLKVVVQVLDRSDGVWMMIWTILVGRDGWDGWGDVVLFGLPTLIQATKIYSNKLCESKFNVVFKNKQLKCI